MAEGHVHTIAKIEDYEVARRTLRAEMRRKLVRDACLFGLLAIAMWVALMMALDARISTQNGLIWGLPCSLLVLCLGISLSQIAYLSRHARKRLRDLEARTLRGESISCAEFDLPHPIRLPIWLRW
jgi:hypothetical protein